MTLTLAATLIASLRIEPSSLVEFCGAAESDARNRFLSGSGDEITSVPSGGDGSSGEIVVSPNDDAVVD